MLKHYTQPMKTALALAVLAGSNAPALADDDRDSELEHIEVVKQHQAYRGDVLLRALPPT